MHIPAGSKQQSILAAHEVRRKVCWLSQGETTMASCSIVIRAYNEEAHIGRLLMGICQQAVNDPQVILVDSGSTDATVAIASRYPVQVVHIRQKDFTFGRSLNLGLRHATSERVVLASAHVYPVYSDWLEKLLCALDDPQVALSYGKQRGGSITKFSEHQLFARWFPDQAQPRQCHPFCNNANAAIRRSWWEEHPYDETLPGLEDLAWARWAMEKGGVVAYAPDAEVVHLHNETPRGVYHRYRREAVAFKRIFPHERFDLLDFVRLFTTNAASDAWHAARQRAFFRNLSSILWFRWMQFWGTYQGYRDPGPLTWQLKQTFYYPRDLGSATVNRRGMNPIRYPDVGRTAA
jgi:rhamnosyltransferase